MVIEALGSYKPVLPRLARRRCAPQIFSVSGVRFLQRLGRIAYSLIAASTAPTKVEGMDHMAQIDNRYAAGYGTRTDVAVDEGLRAYMLRVYNYMAAGVFLTGIVAYVTASAAITSKPGGGKALTEFGQLIYVSPLKWVMMLLPLGLRVLPVLAHLQDERGRLPSWPSGCLPQPWALSLSSIFLVLHRAVDLAGVLRDGGGLRRPQHLRLHDQADLSGWGSFLIMGVIGIIIASLVNLFLQSGALQFAISVIGVLVFAGLTAYDTQRIKDGYYEVMGDATAAAKAAIMGALNLYLDFINMFVMMLAAVRQPRVSSARKSQNEGPASAGPFAFVRCSGNFSRPSLPRAATACRSRRIRPATPADVPAITAIYRPAVLQGTASFELEPPDEAEMLRRFQAIVDAGYPYFVAELDGRVAGYAYASAYRARPGYRFAVEDSIYIAPDAQGKGLGRLLLRRDQTPPRRRASRLMIAVIGDSAKFASITLHRRAGFTFSGTIHSVGYKFGRWLDCVDHAAAARRGRHDNARRARRCVWLTLHNATGAASRKKRPGPRRRRLWGD